MQHGVRSIFEESGLLAQASPEQQRAVEAQNLGVIMTRINEMRRNPAIVVVSEDIKGAKVQGGIELCSGDRSPAGPGADTGYPAGIDLPGCPGNAVRTVTGSKMQLHSEILYDRILITPIPHM